MCSNSKSLHICITYPILSKYDCNLKQSFKVYSIDFLLLFEKHNREKNVTYHITLEFMNVMSKSYLIYKPHSVFLYVYYTYSRKAFWVLITL